MATALAGIDVSAYQGSSFPWESYRGKIQFAGVKISEGLKGADPYAARNVAGARSIGVTVIGYHFLHASLSGSGQCEAFLSHAHAAGMRAGDLHAVDAEDDGLDGESPAQMNLTAGAFVAEERRHFPSYWPVAYTEQSMAPFLTSLANCPPWIANISGEKFTAIGPWKVIAFEQVGQKGVDQDLFYGSSADLAKLAIPK
jgi:GH25 family lysozyme M1 (1,4-beta-N-acetylmuramidase)